MKTIGPILLQILDGVLGLTCAWGAPLLVSLARQQAVTMHSEFTGYHVLAMMGGGGVYLLGRAFVIVQWQRRHGVAKAAANPAPQTPDPLIPGGTAGQGPRAPANPATWILWHRDTFDRETPPAQEASGVGLEQGLSRLWQATFSEGIDDTGETTFSAFSLAWGKGSAGEQAGIDTSSGQPLLTLRGWLQQRPALLGVVAATHARLIRNYRPTVTALSGFEESSAILTAVEGARDLDEFERSLDNLTLVASPR